MDQALTPQRNWKAPNIPRDAMCKSLADTQNTREDCQAGYMILFIVGCLYARLPLGPRASSEALDAAGLLLLQAAAAYLPIPS